MPLSDQEQRMLDEIESALYAEDPKYGSSVGGGGLRAPTARPRGGGAAVCIAGRAVFVPGRYRCRRASDGPCRTDTPHFATPKPHLADSTHISLLSCGSPESDVRMSRRTRGGKPITE